MCLHASAHKPFERNQLRMWCGCDCCSPNRLNASAYPTAHFNDWLAKRWMASGDRWDMNVSRRCGKQLEFHRICGMQRTNQIANRLKWSSKWGFKSIIRTTVSNVTITIAASSQSLLRDQAIIAVYESLWLVYWPYLCASDNSLVRQSAWLTCLQLNCGRDLHAHMHFVRRVHM